MEAMGGMDLGAIFGGAATTEKKQDPDYGVYSYGNGVLSLGSFWYPSLAVRQNGQWMDEAPSGVGDVGFSEASDFSLGLSFVADAKRPADVSYGMYGVIVATSGSMTPAPRPVCGCRRNKG